MTDEKFRSGGFGTPKVSGVDAKLLRDGLHCELLLAFSFDLTDPHPEKRFTLYADTAAAALLLETTVKAKIPAKGFEVLGTKADYEKWCQSTQ